MTWKKPKNGDVLLEIPGKTRLAPPTMKKGPSWASKPLSLMRSLSLKLPKSAWMSWMKTAGEYFLETSFRKRTLESVSPAGLIPERRIAERLPATPWMKSSKEEKPQAFLPGNTGTRTFDSSDLPT